MKSRGTAQVRGLLGTRLLQGTGIQSWELETKDKTTGFI